MLVGAPERQARGDGGAILQAHADDSPSSWTGGS